MADAKNTIKILGKDLEVTVNKGAAKVSMSKGDFNAVLAEKGVTPEVAKVVTAAHDAIVAEVSQAQTDWLLKANKGKKEDSPEFVKSFDAALGSGNGGMHIKKIPHKHSEGSFEGKPWSKDDYGVTIVSLNYALAREAKKEGGVFDLQAKAFEKALGGKK